MKKFSLILIAAISFCSCKEIVTGIVKETGNAITEDEKVVQAVEEKPKSGTFTRVNQRSKVKSVYTLADGRKQGPAYQYYTNGDPWKEVHYTSGVLDGVAKIYYRGNRLKREVHYSAGMKHGDYVAYFKSGNEKLRLKFHKDFPLPGYTLKDAYGEAIAEPEILYREIEERTAEGAYAKRLLFSLSDHRELEALYIFPEKHNYREMLPDIAPFHISENPDGVKEVVLRCAPGERCNYELHVYAIFEIRKGLMGAEYRKIITRF